MRGFFLALPVIILLGEGLFTVQYHVNDTTYEDEVQGYEYYITPHSGFKSYEGKDAFHEGYAQKALADRSECDEDGLCMINGRYLVAIGTAFDAKIGQWFDLKLANGVTIPCIMGDVKADVDTDEDNLYTLQSDCCSEFIVSRYWLREDIRLAGDVSKKTPLWDSPVEGLVLYEIYEQ